MAYTPINWQTGDTITAEKLNKMDNGWEAGSSSQILFSGTVTTKDDGGEAWGVLEYLGTLNADTLSITFDGTPYLCPRISTDSFGNVYGGWDGSGADFSTIPFLIWAAGKDIQTASEGTFTISVSAEQSSVETSADFQKAVLSAGVFIATNGTTTWQEIHDAMSVGKVVFVKVDDGSGTVEHRQVLLVSSSSGYEVSAAYADGGSVGLAYFAAQSADSPIVSS